jgi:predicted RNA-binding Zn ribbon-like protein
MRPHSISHQHLVTSKTILLVFHVSQPANLICWCSMGLAEKYAVPGELALLYEFLNSIDLRSYVEQGAAHTSDDELATLVQFKRWMQERALLAKGDVVSAAEHRRALALREALRSYLNVSPEDRAGDRIRAAQLSSACAVYPLVLRASNTGAVTLQPVPGTSGLGRVIAQFFALAETGRLDRLKVCSSDECHWVFFDRSKPSNRRWCSSSICGNRHKTRAYRDRQRGGKV